MIGQLIVVARIIVLGLFVFATFLALAQWAVRTRRLSPFGRFARLIRRVSDPIVLPIERRVIRAGGNPQDAPLWFLGVVVVGGLVLLSAIGWIGGLIGSLRYSAQAGPRAVLFFVVNSLFSLLMAALFVRVIASWLGVSPYRKWMRPIMLLTDWLVEPIRRVLPPLGMLDFSPLVAWLVLWLARSLVLSLL